MTEWTILLIEGPERVGFVVIELRRLEDGSAELHQHFGAVGHLTRHTAEPFSTVRLAEAARADLLTSFRRHGFRRRELGPDRARSRSRWDVMLAEALERMRASQIVRESTVAPATPTQLALALVG